MLNSMLSAEVGAVAAAAPPTSQLPGTAQSPPLAPFHVYVPAKAAHAAIIAPQKAIFFIVSMLLFFRRAPLTWRADLTLQQFQMAITYHIPTVSRKSNFLFNTTELFDAIPKLRLSPHSSGSESIISSSVGSGRAMPTRAQATTINIR